MKNGKIYYCYLFIYTIPGVPIDIFIELVPVLGLYPATVFTGNASIGLRWFL